VCSGATRFDTGAQTYIDTSGRFMGCAAPRFFAAFLIARATKLEGWATLAGSGTTARTTISYVLFSGVLAAVLQGAGV